MTDENKVRIKYIGKKEFMPDFISGSGKNWEGYGDVQDVTVEQSKKLLVHDDEFAEAAAHDALLVKQEEERAAQESANAAEEEKARAEADANSLEEQAKAEAEAARLKEEQDSAKPAPADSAATIPTAEEIAAMNKLALLDLAADHAVTVNDAAPVVTLRNQLTAALHPAA